MTSANIGTSNSYRSPLRYGFIVRIGQRRRLGLALGVAGAGVSVNSFTPSLVAWVTAALIWRLACAVACPRSVPAIRLASLSHMLMNGFFFKSGLEGLVSAPVEC